jgi:hypothetical protein
VPARPVRRRPRALSAALAGAALATALGAVPTAGPAAAAAPAYEELPVPLPAGFTAGQALGLYDGPDGPVVVAVAADGVMANPATRVEAYLWTPRTGHVVRVNDHVRGPRVFPTGVASDGRLVGAVQRGGDARDSSWFLWSPARPDAVREWPLLPAPGQPWLTPADVDAAGRIYGDGGGWDVHVIAASWQPPGEARRLSHRMSSIAQANDAGQAVGNGTHPFGGQVATLWCSGREVPLSPRTGADGAGFSPTARAISPGGLAAGNSGRNAVLWRDGRAVDLGTLGPVTWASGVNDAGLVVGNTGYPGEPALSTAWRALPGGRAEPLEGLLSPGTGWDELWLAADVDEQGRIAGTGLLRGQERGFVLLPTDPLPPARLAPGSAQPACTSDRVPLAADPFELRVPLQPDGFDVEPGSRSLTVRWLPPDYGHPLSGFHVVLESPEGRRDLTAGPGATELRVDGLTDGRTYTVWLRAVNAAGPGPHIGRDAMPGSAWARQPYDACPAGRVPLRRFDDAEGYLTLHSEAVHCASMWGLLRGTAARTFSPADPVTRGQAATALVGLVDGVAGPDRALPADPPDAFRDDDGSVHERAVDRLAAAGLLTGTADGRAAVDAPLTRGQLVSLLVRVLEHVRADRLEARGDLFDDDDGSAHERAADRAGAAGVVAGTGPRTASPGRTLRRDQFSSFAVRALDVLVEEGRARPPVDPDLPAW